MELKNNKDLSDQCCQMLYSIDIMHRILVFYNDRAEISEKSKHLIRRHLKT